MIKFLIRIFGEEKLKTIFRCIDKATIVHFDGHNCLIADDVYIYYFATSKPMSKSFYKFYNKYKHKMKSKLFYANNLAKYKNRCIQIEGELYQWLG